MPLYEYLCERCGRTTEILQRLDEPPLGSCPQCGGPVKKQFSAPAFHLKGTGWYATDYAKKSGGGGERAKSGESGASESKGETSGGEASSGSSSETKSEGKSAGKSESKSESKSETKSESKGDSGPAKSAD